jgi:phenylalanyl-tRNA synthetase beta chain
VFHVGVTPNRPDALGVAGIARDLAAKSMGRLVTPDVAPVPGEGPCPVAVSSIFPNRTGICVPAFALRLVRGVRNGPSPDWMQRRLRAIGLRPINALVDITNYVTYDRSRPLHVFDAAKVKGDLVVRLAMAGEQILALDGRTYALDGAMVVIADDNGPESHCRHHGWRAFRLRREHHRRSHRIGAVGPGYRRAHRAPSGHRIGRAPPFRARRRPGLHRAGPRARGTARHGDLRRRAERDFGRGEVPESNRIIDFDPSQVVRLTGLDLPFAEIKVVLTRLGFWVTGDESTRACRGAELAA